MLTPPSRHAGSLKSHSDSLRACKYQRRPSSNICCQNLSRRHWMD